MGDAIFKETYFRGKNRFLKCPLSTPDHVPALVYIAQASLLVPCWCNYYCAMHLWCIISWVRQIFGVASLVLCIASSIVHACYHSGASTLFLFSITKSIIFFMPHLVKKQIAETKFTKDCPSNIIVSSGITETVRGHHRFQCKNGIPAGRSGGVGIGGVRGAVVVTIAGPRACGHWCRCSRFKFKKIGQVD